MSKWKKARKKPVVIEYREVEPKEHFFDIELRQWVLGERIKTREGTLHAICGRDFIIRGVDGELYPIKKRIFYKTYDILDDAEQGLEKVTLRNLRELLESRPRLQKTYGSPSIHADEDLEMLIEDYNRIERWLEEFTKAFDKFEERFRSQLTKCRTFPEMVVTNALCCTKFPYCEECKEKCAIERWIKLDDLEEILGE